MKSGAIITPNSKGQIVIPAKMRDDLDIKEDTLLSISLVGQGIYITPVDGIVTRADRENSYLEILNRTQGSWIDEDWELLRKKRKLVELAASKKRQKLW